MGLKQEVFNFRASPDVCGIEKSLTLNHLASFLQKQQEDFHEATPLPDFYSEEVFKEKVQTPGFVPECKNIDTLLQGITSTQPASADFNAKARKSVRKQTSFARTDERSDNGSAEEPRASNNFQLYRPFASRS